MPLYEKLDPHGDVVERVQTIEGSLSDTELAVLVEGGAGEWRLAGTAPSPQPSPEPLKPEVSSEDTAGEPDEE